MRAAERVQTGIVAKQFNLPPGEITLNKYNCMRKGLAGLIFITTTFVCFDTLVPSLGKCPAYMVLSFYNLDSMKKNKLNGITIFSEGQKYSFINFSLLTGARNAAYALILKQARALDCKLWRNCPDYVPASDLAGSDLSVELNVPYHNMFNRQGTMQITARPSDEQPNVIELEEFKCTYRQGVGALKGTLVITTTGFYFKANFLVGTKTVNAPWEDVKYVKRTKTFGLEGIEIGTVLNSYSFIKFKTRSRDEAFEIILTYRNGRV